MSAKISNLIWGKILRKLLYILLKILDTCGLDDKNLLYDKIGTHSAKPFFLFTYLPYLAVSDMFPETLLFLFYLASSFGWGKGCIRFWGRLEQNSGFHGNRKRTLTYNGENDVSTFSLLFLIKLAGNEERHKISDEFEFRPDRTTAYAVSCP